MEMAKLCSDTGVFELFSPSMVCEFLKEKVPGLSEDVLERVMDHKIDGEVLLELNDANLTEIAPLLGERPKVRKAITTVLAERLTVSFSKYFTHEPLCMLCACFYGLPLR